jgi:hypothetical protein
MNRLSSQDRQTGNAKNAGRRTPKILLETALLCVVMLNLGGPRVFGQFAPRSERSGPSYQKVAGAEAALTLRAQAAPTLIFTGSPARITVEAQLSTMKMRPSQMLLYRLSGGSKQPVGELRAQSNGTSYAGQVILDEPRTGAVVLEVDARFAPANGMYAANLQTAELISNPMTINVLAQHQSPGQTRPPDGNGPSSGKGPTGSNSGWGSFGGALAGGVAGSLLANWLDSHHTSKQTEPGQNSPPQLPQTGAQGYEPPPARPPENSHSVGPQAAANFISAGGLTIKCLAGWSMSQQVLNMGGPIALRNFSEYLRGGIIPEGGAEIEITHVPQDAQSLAETAREELGFTGAPQAVDGQPGLRIFYADEFAPGLNYESVAVYVAHANLLYKFFLSYRASDPQKEKYVSSFDEIVSSARFQ